MRFVAQALRVDLVNVLGAGVVQEGPCERMRHCDRGQVGATPVDLTLRSMPREIDVAPVSPERFRGVLPAARFEEFEGAVRAARELLGGRVVWNVNSTARGGGVVELLLPLIGYARGAGVDARWMAIEGPPEFFAITKRIHNRLHGSQGDGGALDEAARRVYERVLADNAAAFAERVREGDLVILHDPQTAGLVEAM